MTALLATVLLASLLGSPHCAGMCGPFLLLLQGGGRSTVRGQLAIQGAYHGGRLLSYLALGLLAGALGGALDLGGAVFGMQRVAILVTGALLLLSGFLLLLRALGWRGPRLPQSERLTGWSRNAQRFALSGRPVRRAGMVGLFTTLLPCGWLYAFVLGAAGTGSALAGLAVMAGFWVGTLPLLAGLGMGIRLLVPSLRRFAPIASALVLMLLGTAALAGRLEVPALAPKQGPDAVPASLERVGEQIRGLNRAEMPCCDQTSR